ncbi:hypothetical protein DV706_05355 [Natronorubrum bangense]|uniref:Uncharacterized protein n=2 Tax=Natronorubrum bangense TaxID=61858 RepID=L9WGK9_9EURY|nr:hypothetical protein C494_09985 [Natronorubrum bangense JCM 10635]QCC53968.1 hypothetical protein DV706_05355 [Natronorubrum bangense]
MLVYDTTCSLARNGTDPTGVADRLTDRFLDGIDRAGHEGPRATTEPTHRDRHGFDELVAPQRRCSE